MLRSAPSTLRNRMPARPDGKQRTQQPSSQASRREPRVYRDDRWPDDVDLTERVRRSMRAPPWGSSSEPQTRASSSTAELASGTIPPVDLAAIKPSGESFCRRAWFGMPRARSAATTLRAGRSTDPQSRQWRSESLARMSDLPAPRPSHPALRATAGPHDFPVAPSSTPEPPPETNADALMYRVVSNRSETDRPAVRAPIS